MKATECFLNTDLSELWKKSCSGDKDAYAVIVGNHYTSLYHYGTRFTPDRDLIRDCIQDLFLEMWERRSMLFGIDAIKPYLFQSLRNNLLRRVKRQSVFSNISTSDYDTVGDSSPESNWIISETDQLTQERLRHTLERLPKRQKEALYLKYYENLSYEEIAEIMGLQRQAVANYLQYGIQKLREYWKYTSMMLLGVAELFS